MKLKQNHLIAPEGQDIAKDLVGLRCIANDVAETRYRTWPVQLLGSVVNLN